MGFLFPTQGFSLSNPLKLHKSPSPNLILVVFWGANGTVVGCGQYYHIGGTIVPATGKSSASGLQPLHLGGTNVGVVWYWCASGTTATTHDTIASRPLGWVKWWARGVLTLPYPFTSPRPESSLSCGQELPQRPAPPMWFHVIFLVSDRWDQS